MSNESVGFVNVSSNVGQIQLELGICPLSYYSNRSHSKHYGMRDGNIKARWALNNLSGKSDWQFGWLL